MRVRLTNGHVHEADLVISAIGVQPNLAWLPGTLRRDPEGGGILVNRRGLPTVHAPACVTSCLAMTLKMRSHVKTQLKPPCAVCMSPAAEKT